MSNPKHPTQPAIAAVILYRLNVEPTSKVYPTGRQALLAQTKLSTEGIKAQIQPFLFRTEVRA